MSRKLRSDKELKKSINNKRGKWNLLATIVRISTHHPKKTLLIFLAATVVFMVPASQLVVDSSMEGFFGEDMPQEVIDYLAVIEEFGEQEMVTIVVDCSESNDTVAKLYLEDLAEELRATNWFRDVRFTQNIDFAGEHSILYLPKEYLYFLLDSNTTLESAEDAYSQIVETMNEPSYFVSENGNIYLLNMVLNVAIDSAEIRNEIFDGLNEMLDDVQNKDPQYADLEIGYTGGFIVYDYEGDKMALEDIYLVAGVTFICILILLFVSFRSISLPLISLIPLLCGIVITAGLIYIAFGALNIIAAVFAVLLLGLGIDFSIHLLNRFTEELEEHDDTEKALSHTSINTGKAVVLGTLTTAAAFGALIFSKTQAMHEMGIILAVGLVVTLLCVLFILPAVITLRLNIGNLKKTLQKGKRFKIFGTLGRVSSRAAMALVVLLILIGAFFAYKGSDAELSGNISELQPKTVPAYRQLEKVKANFNYTEDYLVCVADSFADLVQSTEMFNAMSEVTEVESILDYLPQGQKEKLEILAQAKVIHPEFSSASWLNVGEMTWSDLPSDIQKDWVSARGKFLIRIKPRGDIWDDGYREELVEQLSAINPNIAGRAIMAPRMMEAMGRDVVRVTMIAVIPILIIVYLGFARRTPIYALLSLVPVVFGVGGVLALSEYCGINLNQISIMMVPLVVGIGIDDGIHILHRYKEEGTGSVEMVIQNTGKAIFLTTATTCLAFSSFTIAEHPGMRAFAQVPVLGLILCFLAAVIFLPALISLLLDRNASKTDRKKS
jgi:predicted RND superfamily exporter protein